jgi:hypothetical protein
MTTTQAPAAINKNHAGINYAIVMKPDDSKIYLDIDELGLHNHEVHTTSAPNAWGDLEKEADNAAFTIIDLHNAASKGLF